MSSPPSVSAAYWVLKYPRTAEKIRGRGIGRASLIAYASEFPFLQVLYVIKNFSIPKTVKKARGTRQPLAI